MRFPSEAPVQMERPHPASRLILLLFLGCQPLGFARAVEPGVDIAAPRVALVSATASRTFLPNLVKVEQGDYVRWTNTAGFYHTSTSGPPCVGTGLWDAILAVGGRFTRQFLESPGAIAYLCSIHCGNGMTAGVTVTTPILVQALGDVSSLDLSWSGGGGAYRVLRSPIPNFTAPTTFQPIGGDAGTSFTDPAVVNVGSINFFLVMNK